MSFPLIAAAHDATCKKGGEWLFHGMAKNKEDQKGESDAIAKDEVEDAKTDCIVYGTTLLVLIALLGICYFIAH